MDNLTYCIFLFSLFLIFSSSFSFSTQLATVYKSSAKTTSLVHVGVILDLSSDVGKVALSCIYMAHSDFYALHDNYSSRIVLHVRDSKGDVVAAACAALDLIQNFKVQAFIGPDASEQVDFLARIGSKAHVPVVSFSATSSYLSSSQFPYFVRIAQNDSCEVKSIAAVVHAYQWKEVSIIHEGTPSGIALISDLTNALQDIGAQVSNRTVLPNNAKKAVIKNTLRKLDSVKTRVFIVHLSFSLSTRFFLHVKKAGMLETGYVWIITSGLANLLDSMDPSIFDSMKGSIGVRTHVPTSKALDNFKVRWKKKFKTTYPNIERVELNVYALWAYDTTFVMGTAANEAIPHLNRNYSRSVPLNEIVENSTKLFDIGMYPMGSNFLQYILRTKYNIGLSGEIRLVDGHLQSSNFEIVNVMEKGGRRVGYWTPIAGLSPSLSSKYIKKNYSANAKHLGPIIFPGDSVAIPSGKRSLRIGVPAKTSFVEFMSISRNFDDNSLNVTGFSIDVFDAVIKTLPYPIQYEYIPFYTTPGAGYYDRLIYQVYLKKYDAAVGDFSIVGNRLDYVAFTPPYTISGVRMIVPIKQDDIQNLWWFVKPLTTGLWLTTIAFFIWKGLLLWIFEHGINTEFQGTVSQQLGKIFSFSFSTPFAQKEKLESNYSRFIANSWTFAVFILVTGYTANLTSILTVNNLQPAATDLDSLLKAGKSVGYQSGSYAREFLKVIGFDDKQLVRLFTEEEYANALSKGSNRNGVSAIVDEIPYINIFLRKYCRQFTIAGPTYRNGGFGFVFPKDSPLLSDVSKAVLEFTEGKGIDALERKWFGPETCPDPLAENGTPNKLRLYNFRGIYIIMGVASTIVLSLFFVSFIYKRIRDGNLRETLTGIFLRKRIREKGRHFNKNGTTSGSFRDIELSINSVEEQLKIHEGLPVTCSIETNSENHDGISDADGGEIGVERTNSQ